MYEALSLEILLFFLPEFPVEALLSSLFFAFSFARLSFSFCFLTHFLTILRLYILTYC